MENKSYLKSYLTDLLCDLEYIEEISSYHPEENVLVHSLQVFELAYHQTKDPELWAAALLHDIGKSIDIQQHATIGADLLQNVLSPRIVWLIQHHLDLLKHPAKTRLTLRNKTQLQDLEKLRQWDLQGRRPNQQPYSVKFAINTLLKFHHIISQKTDNPKLVMEDFPMPVI